jgi:hypothetical protein
MPHRDREVSVEDVSAVLAQDDGCYFALSPALDQGIDGWPAYGDVAITEAASG